MEDTVFFIDRLGVSRYAVGCFDDTALVNGYVYNDRAWTHLLNHIICHQFRSLRTWNEDGTDHDICFSNASFDIERIRHEGLDLMAKDIF